MTASTPQSPMATQLPAIIEPAMLLLPAPTNQLVIALDADAGFSQWLAREEQRRQAMLDSIPTTKQRILAALGSVGVTVLTVNYDGYGDSGQLNDFIATLADGSDVSIGDLPPSTTAIGDDDDSDDAKLPSLTEAVEQFCYDLIDAWHSGYENNEGGNGEFTFDVAAGTVTLVHNDVVIDHDTTIHEV